MKLLLSLILCIFLTTPALAHVSLVNSMPTDGAELDMAPKMVMLTFSEEAKMTGFEVEKDDGEQIFVKDLPKEMTAMAHISLPNLAAGKYVITWHAAAKDMHAMSGSFSFTVK